MTFCEEDIIKNYDSIQFNVKANFLLRFSAPLCDQHLMSSRPAASNSGMWPGFILIQLVKSFFKWIFIRIFNKLN